MSMWYDDAGVRILKDSVSPAFTLIAVAKPWIVESPAPATSQSLSGSPVRVFSQAITLTTGGPQGLPAARPRLAGSTAAMTATTPITATRAHQARDVELSDERDTGPPSRSWAGGAVVPGPIRAYE